MLLRLLHAIGLTNLTDEQVARYEALPRPVKRAGLLKFLHAIGLTNLSDEDIQRCSALPCPPLSFTYTSAPTVKLPGEVPDPTSPQPPSAVRALLVGVRSTLTVLMPVYNLKLDNLGRRKAKPPRAGASAVTLSFEDSPIMLRRMAPPAASGA